MTRCHVSTFADVQSNGDCEYGWQCSCGAEQGGFRWFGDAEDAGIRHTEQAVAS